MKTIKGFKGFDKDLKCKGFQYEVGKTFEEDGEVKVCEKGFHFCENPADVFVYYPPSYDGSLNRFCEVSGSGKMDKESDGSKVACSKIHISAEIGLKGLIDAWVKFILDKVDKNKKESNTGCYSAATNTGRYSAATNTGYRSASTNTGDYSAAANTGDRSVATNTGDCSAAANTGACSAATNTGYRSAATNTGDQSAATNTGRYSAATNTGRYSAATNTGDYSAATNTGDYSAATNTGDRSAAINTGCCSVATNTGDRSAATNTGYRSAAEVSGKASIAIVTGMESKAKGAIGCWIVLTERDVWDGETFPILSVKAFKVDGKEIKADTYYKLVNGEPMEVE